MHSCVKMPHQRLPRNLGRPGKEKQPRQKADLEASIKEEAYGIYRPLTPASAKQVRKVLQAAQKPIKEYLRENRPDAAKLTIAHNLGVTFLMKERVREAMGMGFLPHLVELGQQLQSIEDGTQRERVALKVPLFTPDWYGVQKRTLVSQLDEGQATEQLAAQGGVIGDLMGDLGLDHLDVYQPNHVSLYHYGEEDDGKQLSVLNRRAVGSILHRQFIRAEVRSIELGSLVIGDSYDQPKAA